MLTSLFLIAMELLPLLNDPAPNSPVEPAPAAAPKTSTVGKINFIHSLEDAQKAAAASGKPVIAFFTFDTCVWCHRLEDACFSDAEVLKLASQFTFAYVDRDVDRSVPERFNVSSFPCLIVLNEKSQKIHRITGFKKPPEFIAELTTALNRWTLYKEGKSWEPEPTRPGKICDSGTVTHWPTPLQETTTASELWGGKLWIVQKDTLYGLDPKTGEVASKMDLPAGEYYSDMAADGSTLYLLPKGWTKGDPILAVDPAALKITGRIATEVNKTQHHHGASGLHIQDGVFLVMEGMLGKIHKVTMSSGEILSTHVTGLNWLGSLAAQGNDLIATNTEGVIHLDSKSFKAKGSLKTHYRVFSLAADDKTLYLFELPIMDHDKDHKSIRVWPKTFEAHRVELAAGVTPAPAAPAPE